MLGQSREPVGRAHHYASDDLVVASTPPSASAQVTGQGAGLRQLGAVSRLTHRLCSVRRIDPGARLAWVDACPVTPRHDLSLRGSGAPRGKGRGGEEDHRPGGRCLHRLSDARRSAPVPRSPGPPGSCSWGWVVREIPGHSRIAPTVNLRPRCAEGAGTGGQRAGRTDDSSAAIAIPQRTPGPARQAKPGPPCHT
jgi:hypothetical protein